MRGPFSGGFVRLGMFEVSSTLEGKACASVRSESGGSVSGPPFFNGGVGDAVIFFW